MITWAGGERGFFRSGVNFEKIYFTNNLCYLATVTADCHRVVSKIHVNNSQFVFYDRGKNYEVYLNWALDASKIMQLFMKVSQHISFAL